MRVVITGAAGFIGSHLAEGLKYKYEVVGIDNVSSYYDRRLKQANIRLLAELGIPVFRLDLATDSVADVISGADIVCHLAAQPGINADVAFDEFFKNTLSPPRSSSNAAKQTMRSSCSFTALHRPSMGK